MEYYAGIDVSQKESCMCIVDAKGKIVREVKVASKLETLVRYFDELEVLLCWIGAATAVVACWAYCCWSGRCFAATDRLRPPAGQ